MCPHKVKFGMSIIFLIQYFFQNEFQQSCLFGKTVIDFLDCFGRLLLLNLSVNEGLRNLTLVVKICLPSSYLHFGEISLSSIDSYSNLKFCTKFTPH